MINIVIIVIKMEKKLNYTRAVLLWLVKEDIYRTFLISSGFIKRKICTSSKPQLKFIRDGQSGSLSDLSVQCVKCGEKQSLGPIMKKGALKSILPVCSGERPWIGDQEDCLRKDGNLFTWSFEYIFSFCNKFLANTVE